MISNSVLKDAINGIREIANCELTIVDPTGNIVVSTENKPVAEEEVILSFAASKEETQTVADKVLHKVHDGGELQYIVLTEAKENAEKIGALASFQIGNLLVAYKDHFDQDNFIKNLLLDNLLLVDVYNRATKLHIETNVRRVVYILESDQSKEFSTLEAVKAVFANAKNDFVTAVDENSIIVIKELTQGTPEEMQQHAEAILTAVGGEEGEGKTHVAYGNAVGEIKEVSRSYKEARMALDVGKIFFGGQRIIAYSQLGIGRLIYQLPIPLCKMFIKEIFSDKTPDDFDEETLATINKFFENSLNVSETSRQLFIHRNTLVYRLDKLLKSTGLDLRVFDDAITFKIALMVVQYMKYMETLEY